MTSAVVCEDKRESLEESGDGFDPQGLFSFVSGAEGTKRLIRLERVQGRKLFARSKECQRGILGLRCQSVAH